MKSVHIAGHWNQYGPPSPQIWTTYLCNINYVHFLKSFAIEYIIKESNNVKKERKKEKKVFYRCHTVQLIDMWPLIFLALTLIIQLGYTVHKWKWLHWPLHSLHVLLLWSWPLFRYACWPCMVVHISGTWLIGPYMSTLVVHVSGTWLVGKNTWAWVL